MPPNLILTNVFKKLVEVPQNFNFLPDNELGYKDTLLITIGDSWTWGGSFQFLIDPLEIADFSFSPSYPSPALQKFRLDNIFGNKLRQYLDADWYNVSLPGMSNQWMAEQFQCFSKIRDQLTYKKIYVIITLTECGREWGPLYNSKILQTSTTLDQLVYKSSSIIEDKILSCLHDDIHLIIGRNYVDDSYPNLEKFMLSNSWLEVLLKTQNKKYSDNSCYVLGGIAFDRLNGIASQLPISKENFLSMANDYLDRAQQRLDLLETSDYNIHKIGYQHPTPQGHQIWADYIYNYIQSN